MDPDDYDQLHTVYLAFSDGQWTATIAGVAAATNHVLAHVVRATYAYVNDTWGPYEEVYYESSSSSSLGTRRSTSWIR